VVELKVGELNDQQLLEVMAEVKRLKDKQREIEKVNEVS